MMNSNNDTNDTNGPDSSDINDIHTDNNNIDNDVSSTGLIAMLKKSLSNAEKAIVKKLAEFQQLLIRCTKEKTLAEFQQLLIKYIKEKTLAKFQQWLTGRKRDNKVPRSLPSFQLIGDPDNEKTKTSCETINKFFMTIELVVYQHCINLDVSYKSYLLATVQHSLAKATWFRDNLKYKSLQWIEVKQVISKRFRDKPPKRQIPAKKTNSCEHCDKPWDHQCKEFLQHKADKFAARMAKLQLDNEEPKSNNSRNKGKGKAKDQTYEDAMSDNEYELASTKRKREADLTQIIVPINIGCNRLYALVDTGCTFSSIDSSIVIKNKYEVNKEEGFITLANKSSKVKRKGRTNELEVLYNGKKLFHSFEVMDLPEFENYKCVIGTDLLSFLGIYMIGLAVSFNDNTPSDSEEEISDIPEPDHSPAGTEQEQNHFFEQIKESMQNNLKIDPKSFCSVPESKVTLDTPEGKTCYRRQYPIPDKLMPLVDEAVNKWKAEGTVIRSTSNNQWNSPLTLAPKKDADGKKTKKRPCLDPRHINNLLPDDKFPIPLIREIFEKLKNSRVFTTLDLKNAFHRFQIDPKDQHKTTFTHRDEQLMFQGCPFGLKPLSSKFQRVTSLILKDMNYATSFIDDIVVFSQDMHQHAKHVKAVIDKLTEVKLILNSDKCHFAQRSVNLLGFCVSEKGLTLDTRKVSNVQNWPRPQTGNDVEKFLGVINYFRDHIPMISSITAPLDKLRKKKSLAKDWTDLCETAFQKLKIILTRTPILKYPQVNEPYYVATDASNDGIGAVLFQMINKKVHHIGFFARSLSKSERNYNTTKRELLAVVFALNKFHKYLWGNHFTLFTDHKALVYIHTQKYANPMMINWYDTLLQYNFTVAHIPGMTNILPDALSRLFPVEKELAGDDDTQEHQKHHKRTKYNQEKMKKLVAKHEKMDLEKDTGDRERKMSELEKSELEKTEKLIPHESDRKAIIHRYHRAATLHKHAHFLQPEERISKTIEGKLERESLLERQHAFGHFGADAMIKAIQADGMTWPNIKQDALEMVKRCNQCMQYNVVRKGYHPLASITANAPGDHWAIDLAGEFTETHNGNVYILVMVDICTKFIIAKPIPDKTAVTIANVLIDVFCTFGFPKIIQSDNGTEFVNGTVDLLMKTTRINHRVISAYHPRANGAAENKVKTVKATLEKEIDGESRDWDLYLPAVQMAINAKIVRLHGSAPFSLMFARKLNEFKDYSSIEATPARGSRAGTDMTMQRIKDMSDIVLPAIAQRTYNVRNASQKKFDKTHKIIDYKVGSLVSLLKPTRTTQMETKYTGPFTVVKKNKGGAYTLQQSNGELLPKAFPPSALKSVSQDPILQEEERWEVESIINHKGSPGNYQYKVRWKGYDSDADTWEPKEMFDSTDTIKEYWNKRNMPYQE
ncbi:hypothetical protein [Absidia glauca]|uniref:Reverse transcriptase n=1 Tax=Absidia glauca TaxID=4829 RepID=A0A163JWI1_ABSGL|nr:hypothetical protein [Absidia glauca]